MNRIEKKYIQEVIECARRLDQKGMVNGFEGNISTRHNGLIYITPTGMSKATLTEDMIAVVDENGIQIAGSFRPTSELPMHMDAYAVRDDIVGVIHTHAPFLTAHALCNIPVETHAYPEMMGNFGRFEVAPYGRPGTDAIFEGAVPILKKRDVCLLGNHGAISVGTSLVDAMNKMEAAESIAKTLFIARMMGKAVDLSDEECAFFFSLSDR